MRILRHRPYQAQPVCPSSIRPGAERAAPSDPDFTHAHEIDEYFIRLQRKSAVMDATPVHIVATLKG
ncbi:hypothetical protein [Labrys monachus]|uniref:Uncharacterized protein n=1 Tax=Labrys monachus TaxID=217067 RepID=A0ABU0FJD1_9HYPH|nr:hypothetical protein [Labrys monachus]MDQ0394591.1 hypothetical protein [Labrys monachus]